MQLIEEQSQCSPNIEIIKNKKNPNNGLAIITPSSKKNEELIKQALGNNFYFENRKITLAQYSNKRFKIKKNENEKETKKNYLKEKNKESNKNTKIPTKPQKISSYNAESDPQLHQKPNSYHDTKNKKKKNDLIRSNMKANSASKNNTEIVPNTLFLHNIPYHANYYDIEHVLKPLITIKELILLLDSYNQFKGCAKLIFKKKEDLPKLLTYSGKLNLFNRYIFVNKFIKNKDPQNIKQPNNEKEPLELNKDKPRHTNKKNKNNEWFEKNFLNKNKNNNNTQNHHPSINNQKNNQKYNKILINKNRKTNRKFSNNQIVIFNLPTNITEEFLYNLFKNYKIEKIIILNNKNNNQKYSFISFQNEYFRDKALSLNGVFAYENKIIIKKAYEKKNFERNNELQSNHNSNNFTEIFEKRITNLENEIKKLKLIIKNTSNNPIEENQILINKKNKNFQEKTTNLKKNPKMDYIEKNENENENENSIEIEMEIEEDDNKSEDKIIIKQKNNKPSLADFYISIGQTVTKQKPNLRALPFTNNFKNIYNFNLPNINFLENQLNNLFKVTVENDEETFEFLKNFKRKNNNKTNNCKSSNFLINQLVENKNKILNQKNFLVKNKKNNNVCRDIIVYNERTIIILNKKILIIFSIKQTQLLN
ncbi:hypothetical protein M0813_25077 [Anaeramoeba flamelloides]|uniref:RRM domain-containing protein n=1 Tax=Anaeramoeba flamelloides TaxID=1746091 RepID=A0ABQ8Y4V0_9EUKA|nr:hypothetical protein M0813_25077 [Anaeramoeba flamelloides]